MIQAVTSDRPDRDVQHIRFVLDEVLAGYGVMPVGRECRGDRQRPNPAEGTRDQEHATSST
jgi:hypothetical protein